MRKLALKMSISLDGFVGGPNGEVDWIFHSTDNEVTAWTVQRLCDASLHIMGSRTFQDMKAWWPRSDEPYAAPMNEIPKAFFSRGGSDVATTTTALEDAKRLRRRGEESAARHAGSWEQAQMLTGDLATEITKRKEEDGKPILAHGGAGFVSSLMATGLIDEYNFLVHPVALGQGLPIFAELTSPLSLALVRSTRFASGTIANVYEPA